MSKCLSFFFSSVYKHCMYSFPLEESCLLAQPVLAPPHMYMQAQSCTSAPKVPRKGSKSLLQTAICNHQYALFVKR